MSETVPQRLPRLHSEHILHAQPFHQYHLLRSTFTASAMESKQYLWNEPRAGELQTLRQNTIEFRCCFHRAG